MKSISEGSAADLSNKIQINDRIVEVDGHSLQGYTNHEAVEVLRRTGQTVSLCLERYLRGPKFEQLQQAIAASELRPPQPSSPSITSLPSFPMSAVRLFPSDRKWVDHRQRIVHKFQCSNNGKTLNLPVAIIVAVSFSQPVRSQRKFDGFRACCAHLESCKVVKTGESRRVFMYH